MSDALTDISRDEARSRAFSEYAAVLLDYVKDKATLKRVTEAAECVDGVPQGYWGSRTSFSEGAKDTAEKLKAGDPATWAQMIFNLKDSWSDWNLYAEYKKLSPFDEKAQLLYVDFSDTWDDKLKPLFSDAIKNAGLCTSQFEGGDRYLLVIDQKVLDEIVKSAVWMGFRETSWVSGAKWEKPTTPFRKDRKK
jgi:hypothetical protein